MLQKTSKNNIQWTGGTFDGSLSQYSPPDSSSSHDSPDTIARKIRLEMELDSLEAQESELDALIKSAENTYQELCNDPANKRHAFVTYRDLRDIREFYDQTVIAIKAPHETRLEVPDPNQEVSISIHISISTVKCSEIIFFLLLLSESLANLVEE